MVHFVRSFPLAAYPALLSMNKHISPPPSSFFITQHSAFINATAYRPYVILAACTSCHIGGNCRRLSRSYISFLFFVTPSLRQMPLFCTGKVTVIKTGRIFADVPTCNTTLHQAEMFLLIYDIRLELIIIGTDINYEVRRSDMPWTARMRDRARFCKRKKLNGTISPVNSTKWDIAFACNLWCDCNRPCCQCSVFASKIDFRIDFCARRTQRELVLQIDLPFL